MKKNLIKKASVLAVCAAMAFGVAACGGSTEETPADETQVEETVGGEEEVVEEEVVDDAAAEDETAVDGEDEAPVEVEEEVAE